MKELTVEDVEEITGEPFENTAKNCHVVSLAIVRSGFYPVSRVARGIGAGVGSQHSWVVVGDDVYADDAQIVDPTLWSYDTSVEGVWHGSARDGRHHPHGGQGSIWTYGRPDDPSGPVIELETPLSKEASDFLKAMSPRGLDFQGWNVLAHAPVHGWPAAEIIGAMWDTKAIRALIPIDIVGNLTDRNPHEAYLNA